MTMLTPDADRTASSEIPPTVVVPTRQGGLVVNVRFDRTSVWRSGLVIMGLVAALLLFLWLFSMLSHFLFLVLLAWLLSIALEPGIRWLVQRGRSRGVATGIVGGGALLVALALAVVFGQLFFNQIADFVTGVPDLTTSVIDWVNQRFGTNLDPTTISSKLHLDPSQIASWAGSLSGGLLGVVGSLSAVLFDLVTVLVFAFYFAGDGPNLVQHLASWMPPRGQQVFITISEITIAKTGGYVVSKIVLAAASAFFHGIFFAAIGVPYWLPFALFAGITAQFVPILGTYLGVILPVLATVFTSPWTAVAIIAFAAVYQQIETYFFTPHVSKKTMDVNPAIALGAVFVGAAIWGPLGALIGIPLAAAGVAILDTYSHRYDLVPDVLNVGDATTELEPT
ncbi:MAG TPA: AI-2E family transporter [Actinomycetes bacterium]|nr:AI-2E family transporter [Actinomycetes bacterium]